MHDRKLMKWKSDQSGGFMKIVEDNIKLAYSFAHKYQKCFDWMNMHDFEDLVSDCFLGLVKAGLNYKDNFGLSFSTYAYICMKNEILISVRKKKQQDDKIFNLEMYDKNGEAIDDVFDVLLNSTENLEEKMIDILLLAEALQVLTDIERKIIVMYYYQGLKISHIAKIFGFTESYISKIHSRAIKKLKRKLL